MTAHAETTSTPIMRETVETVGLVLVNGPAASVQAPRARALFGESTPIVFKEHGRMRSVRAIWNALEACKAGWIYCIDIGFPSALLAAIRRKTSRSVRLVYEIGDPGLPLMKPQGRPRWEVRAAHEADRRLPPVADRLVFRGSYLIDYFRALGPKALPPSMWLPDGVDTNKFRPQKDDRAVAALKRRHGLEGQFVVGLVGNIHHSARLNLFYGWELAEALALLPRSLPVVGVVVGDGPGKPVLEATKTRLGLGDRLRLVGRVSHEEVPLWMNAFDAGLSTQTDDPVGWGRTTAKLPEYLACGTVVVCTDVGEAHRWLKTSGQTLPYRGLRDDGYPQRLAERIHELFAVDLGSLRVQNRALALKLFDYNVLRGNLASFLGAPRTD